METITRKQELLELIKNLTVKKYELESAKDNEIRTNIATKVLPLRKEADIIEQSIKKDAAIKHQPALENVQNEIIVVERELIELKTTENKHKWYPEDTVLFEWTSINYTRPQAYKLTGRKGIVKIYNHSIDISCLSRWGRPKEGDIILLLVKKDGSTGKKFENITDHWEGELNYKARYWLPEGQQFKE